MTFFYSDLIYRGMPTNGKEWAYGSYIERWDDGAPDDIELCLHFIAPNEPYTLVRLNEDTWIHKVIEIQRDSLGIKSSFEDCNGETIFSGDILELDPEDECEGAKAGRYVVFYWDGTFIGEGDTVLQDRFFSLCHVIGNSTQNRALAKSLAPNVSASERMAHACDPVSETEGADEGDEELTYYRVNRIRCKRCGDILEHVHLTKEIKRHTMMSCSCGAVQLDPHVIAPRVFGALKDIECLSEVWHN